MARILLMLTFLMMKTANYSGSMRKRALYNYKNFTDAHSLDDEPSNISEHGDFVWTVNPNNKQPSYENSVMCFVHLTLLTRIRFERTHENVTYTSFVCLTKLIKKIIKISSPLP